MNCKNLHIILSFIAFALMVLSSPIISDESSTEEEEEITDDLSVAELISEEEITEIFGEEITKGLKIIENLNVTEIPEPNKNPNQNDEICDTPECQLKAKNILDMLNLDVHPCDDFYEFACGNWMKNNEEIPKGKSSIGSNEDVYFENLNTIKKTIEEGYKVNENLTPELQEYDKKNFEQIANFYESCMDIKTINSKGIQPILDTLKELKINENKTGYHNVKGLTDLLVKVHNYGINVLFETRVITNLKDSKMYSLYISQPTLSLNSKKYYEDPTISNLYKNIMKSVFTKLFQDQKDRNHEKIVESVFELEKKLIDISLTEKDFSSSSPSPSSSSSFIEDDGLIILSFPNHVETNIKSLNKSYPFIDWKSYLNDRYENLGLESVYNDESIIVNTTPQYFEKLMTILKDIDSETIAAFSEWSFIMKYMTYFSDDVQEILNDFYLLLYGMSYKDIPRESLCIDLFTKHLSMEASKLFVEKKFSKESKVFAENIIENVKKTVIDTITKTSWLDDITKENALKKASSITLHIGYPDFIMEPEKLYKYYEELDLHSNEFLNNILKSTQFEIKKNLNDFGREVDRERWDYIPFKWNAFYDPNLNLYTFLAGILQEPSFSSNYPNYLNYGATGMVVGHELTHAFDNFGKDYDDEGHYHNWWTNSTQQEFDRLSKCFIDQYNEYYFTDSKGESHYLNGKRSLGENIADNGGLSRGFEAWQLSLKNDPEAKEHNKSLPGLSQFTHEQLYFIAYGQDRCNKMTEKKEIKIIENDEHPPSSFRVLGTIVNNEYFARVFGCKPNTPMNPENKCKIW